MLENVRYIRSMETRNNDSNKRQGDRDMMETNGNGNCSIISVEDFGRRFRLSAFRTRFQTIEWHVQDFDHVDEYGIPEIVAQLDSREQAIRWMDNRRFDSRELTAYECDTPIGQMYEDGFDCDF